jgi:hypothetical protein
MGSVPDWALVAVEVVPCLASLENQQSHLAPAMRLLVQMPAHSLI